MKLVTLANEKKINARELDREARMTDAVLQAMHPFFA